MTLATVSLFERAGLDRGDARRQLARGLEGADDGELFLEYAQSEALVFDNMRLNGEENPLAEPAFETKIQLLGTIDAYVRAKDPRVRQVSISFGASWQAIEILRADGEIYRDIRPLVRVNCSVVVGDGDRQESGSQGHGGREGFASFLATEAWTNVADEALRQALINLEAVPA